MLSKGDLIDYIL